MATFAPGEVIYEGPANTTIFGACPYYGHGFTVLPYATHRPGHFQLRIVTMSAGRALWNLRPIWHGRYTGPGLLDWHVRAVRLEYSEPMPYQYGGDAQGYRTELEVRTSPVEALNLLRFI